MAFYTTLSASIVAPATKTKNPDGVDIFEVKGICAPNTSNSGIPVLMHVDADSEHGQFLKALSDKTAEGASIRVLVTGLMNPVLAMKNDETKEITKPPKVIVYVGAARRLRADSRVDPEQAIVLAAGLLGLRLTTKTKPSESLRFLSRLAPKAWKKQGNMHLACIFLGILRQKPISSAWT